MMDHREVFPDWKTDVRNIMSLTFCRLERQSRIDGRRLLGRLGISGVAQLLRDVAPISADADGRDVRPVCRADRQTLGRKKSPGGK